MEQVQSLFVQARTQLDSHQYYNCIRDAVTASHYIAKEYQNLYDFEYFIPEEDSELFIPSLLQAIQNSNLPEQVKNDFSTLDNLGNTPGQNITKQQAETALECLKRLYKSVYHTELVNPYDVLKPDPKPSTPKPEEQPTKQTKPAEQTKPAKKAKPVKQAKPAQPKKPADREKTATVQKPARKRKRVWPGLVFILLIVAGVVLAAHYKELAPGIVDGVNALFINQKQTVPDTGDGTNAPLLIPQQTNAIVYPKDLSAYTDVGTMRVTISITNGTELSVCFDNQSQNAYEVNPNSPPTITVHTGDGDVYGTLQADYPWEILPGNKNTYKCKLGRTINSDVYSVSVSGIQYLENGHPAFDLASFSYITMTVDVYYGVSDDVHKHGTEYTDTELIAYVQEQLNHKGYSCGNADGSSGPATRSAIRKYQADHNMRQTGLVDMALLNSLQNQDNKIYGNTNITGFN